MKLEYEKHQRNYTLLAVSLVMEEMMKSQHSKLFINPSQPMYIYVKNGVLYHFISVANYYSWTDQWIKKYDYKKIKKLFDKRITQLLEFHKYIKRDKLDLVQAVDKISWYILELLDIIMLAAYLKVYSTVDDKKTKKILNKARREFESVHRVAIDFQAKLLNKIEKEKNIKKGSLSHLSIEEYRRWLKTKKLPLGASARNKFLMLEHSGKGERILNNKQAKDLLRKIDTRVNNKNVKSAKGMSAYQGVVKGKTKIIMVLNQIPKFKKDEILVTPMTDPRYLPAMKKASAIVTDEGGVTCHAAIVARELKKPCVIGTKISTQVFKNGDRVEVDANKGIIRKI